MTPSQIVGARIREMRQLRQIKQGAVAAACGVRQPQVSKWESGAVTVPVAHRPTIAHLLLGSAQAEIALFAEVRRAEIADADDAAA